MSFHVPEAARITTGPVASDASYGHNGAFDLESPEPGWRLALICSDGTAPDIAAHPTWRWQHVSVHAYREGPKSLIYDPATGRPFRQARPQVRVPSWKEMSFVKRLCWDAEDVVVQYHPRESEYVNLHPAVLHLWRPLDAELPTPPPELVGPLEATP